MHWSKSCQWTPCPLFCRFSCTWSWHLTLNQLALLVKSRKSIPIFFVKTKNIIWISEHGPVLYRKFLLHSIIEMLLPLCVCNKFDFVKKDLSLFFCLDFINGILFTILDFFTKIHCLLQNQIKFPIFSVGDGNFCALIFSLFSQL